MISTMDLAILLGTKTNMTLSALSFISQDSKETCGWDLGNRVFSM